MCCHRLIRALIFRGYRASVWSPLPLAWQDRHRFLQLHSKPKRERSCLHAFRTTHHSHVYIWVSPLLHKLSFGLSHLIPQLQLFALLFLSLCPICVHWSRDLQSARSSTEPQLCCTIHSELAKFYCLRQGTSKRGEGQPFLSC